MGINTVSTRGLMYNSFLKAFSMQSTKETPLGALREALQDADPSVLPLFLRC